MKDLIFLPIELKINKTSFNTINPLHDTFQGIWNTQIIDDVDLEIKEIVDQLPYSKITLIKYNTQSKDVPPHIDVQSNFLESSEEYQHIQEHEPAGYRIVLHGACDKLEVFDGKEWKIARLPQTPFAYVINSTNAFHRVIGENGRKILYFRGFLDVDKHKKMIEKNLYKYSDFAIFKRS